IGRTRPSKYSGLRAANYGVDTQVRFLAGPRSVQFSVELDSREAGKGGMKITEVRTRVVEWRGPTQPLQPHQCTNPMDLLDLPIDVMRSFAFHSWLIVEV